MAIVSKICIEVFSRDNTYRYVYKREYNPHSIEKLSYQTGRGHLQGHKQETRKDLSKFRYNSYTVTK